MKKVRVLVVDDNRRIVNLLKNALVNWEKGTSKPSITQAKELAVIYKIPLDYIFFAD